MKKVFTSFFFLFSLHAAVAGQIYVDSSATGANTGASWEDAFTDLQAALAIAGSGDTILVAQGTYKPGTDPEATFLIDQDLVLIGGYPSGGGSPDPVMYETILTGDLNGDDVDDQAGVEKIDNAMTVVMIGFNVTGAVVIDGFTIRNGFADGIGADIQHYYGGGIFADGNLVVRQCFFTQNYAKQRGGAIYSLSESIILEHCTLAKNKANTGGAIYIKESQYLMDSCTLTQNTAILASFWEANGGGAFIENSSGTIRHCHFQGNEAHEWGGGLMIWSPNSTSGVSTDLAQCTFEDNTSAKRGGGVYFLIRGSNSSNSVSGCSFRKNEAINRGGGLDIFAANSSSNISFSIEDCHFSENKALAFNGGGLGVVLQAQNAQLMMLRDTFSNNTAAFFGGAAEIAGAGSGNGTVGVDSCLFINNCSYNDGGLSIGSVVNAGLFQYHISNCDFIDNEAVDFCGGMDMFAEAPAIFTTENCYFAQNTAGYMGAGIAVATNHPELEVRVANCILENNNSPLGAAIGICPVVPTGGMTQEASILFENCQINANTASDTAAIFIQKTGNVTLLNCTIADNNASGLSLDPNSAATIQNNIFANPGKSELEVQGGNLALLSQGGNLVKDNSMSAFLIPLLDKPGTDPLFENGYYPSEDSPQVNGGVNEGVTAETDLDGNIRKQGFVDIGALESSYYVAVREALAETSLAISPNPLVDKVFVEWPEDISSPIEVRIYNLHGQLLLQENMPTGRGINVTSFPSGLYLLKGSAGGKFFTAKFQKN